MDLQALAEHLVTSYSAGEWPPCPSQHEQQSHPEVSPVIAPSNSSFTEGMPRLAKVFQRSDAPETAQQPEVTRFDSTQLSQLALIGAAHDVHTERLEVTTLSKVES